MTNNNSNTQRRREGFLESFRGKMYAKRISPAELASAMDMCRATWYRKLENLDTLTIGELRALLSKLGYQRSNTEDMAAVENFIWAYNSR